MTDGVQSDPDDHSVIAPLESVKRDLVVPGSLLGSTSDQVSGANCSISSTYTVEDM